MDRLNMDRLHMDRLKPSLFCRRAKAGSVALVVILAGAGRGTAAAQSTPLPIKPGLWEMQVSMTNKMALPPDVEAKIAAMPAAQQAQMRSMMGGMGGGGGQPTTTTRKDCIAPQTSMDSLLNQAQQNPNMKCSFNNRVQTASGASFDISCSGPTGSATGHIQYQMADDEHVSSTTHMTVTATASGHTMNTTIDGSSTGKFVSADCGDVKPFSAGATPAK